MFSESPSTSPCEKFSKEKALSNYIKQKKSFTEPVEITLGIDPTTNKTNTIQYVPILKTITRVLQHEDVLSHCLNSEVSRNDGRMSTYYGSENFKQNKLNSPENSIEIILYHDDLNVVNPLGNKVSKYKVSALYFVIGNVPNQFPSRLKDINLLLLSPASYITKYGYKEILQPCLDDLKKFEAIGISVKFENSNHLFKGSISMVTADNLAAHALGASFVALVWQINFVDFVIALKNNEKGMLHLQKCN